MRRAAGAHPNRVLLIDWARFSAGHGSWFGGDGLHVNQTGARAFARLIRRRVAPLVSPPVKRAADAAHAGRTARLRHRPAGRPDLAGVRDPRRAAGLMRTRAHPRAALAAAPDRRLGWPTTGAAPATARGGRCGRAPTARSSSVSAADATGRLSPLPTTARFATERRVSVSGVPLAPADPFRRCSILSWTNISRLAEGTGAATLGLANRRCRW